MEIFVVSKKRAEMKINRKKSNKLFKEAKKMFPGGVHSPVRAFKSVSGSPLFITKGKGSHIYDVDGNEFLDFCCSWGPLILGHNNSYVRKQITKALANGTSFGTPTPSGNEIGKLILDNHRFLDKIRFVSSGTEAVMSAIRLARGYTNKPKIIKFDGCYHGHVDSLLVKAGSGLATFGVSTSAGIPEALSKETIVLPLNDLKAVEKVLSKRKDVAAIIIEPIPANNGLLIQDKAYLKGLRKLCTKYKTLLIFDEVISGFRVGFEGAAGYYNIQPDLITFGKIIGGGMPVGAFGGKTKIMNHVAPLGNVYQAGTLSANPIALSAGIAMLKTILKKNFFQTQEKKTKFFVDGIMKHVKKKGYEFSIQHIGSIFWFNFSKERTITSDQIDGAKMKVFSKMHDHLLNKGIYIGPSGYEVGFISSAHSYEDLKHAVKIINKTLDKVL